MKAVNGPQKDILFLCQFFYPEYNSSAILPFDTAKYLAAHGFTVDGLVGYPKEYCEDKDFPPEETVDGVRIKRLKYLQSSRVKTLSRLINYFSFTCRVLLKTSFLNNYKTVIVYSNPPILPIVPIRAKRKYGTKFVFVAYDVYPEIACAVHYLSSGSIICKVMDHINKELYKAADCVVALTDEMKDFLLQNRTGLSSDRIKTISNWAHEKAIAPSREAYESLGYREGQFIVSYFGNMGTCQDIETMLEAAELLKGDKRIQFLIIGHGNKKEAAAIKIRNNGLKNVQLIDYLTGTAFEQAVSISSCCIVSLVQGLKGMCAPSKYYSYLQGGRPVLAVVEKDSYLASEVENNRIGYAVEIGNGSGLRDAILTLFENPDECAEMGNRARLLYKTQYAYEVAMEKYSTTLRDLTRQGKDNKKETVYS